MSDGKRRGTGRAGRIAATALLLCLSCGGTEPPQPPNLVLLIGDDHGFRDFGFMGSPHARTPNLDRLAAEGSVFPLTYTTASVCREAMLSLLTGVHPIQYSARELALRKNGAQTLHRGELLRGFDTLPRLLEARGYASFQAGKYHEGHFASGGFTHGMVERRGEAREVAKELVRETFDPVFQFLEEQRDGPFFLWFAPVIPHLPHDPPAEFFEPYADAGLSPAAAAYFASVSWFDWGAGVLLQRLETLGLRENTLVVYVADNGWENVGPGVVYESMLGGTHGKRSLYEPGFRTPLIFHWPGHVPAGQVHAGPVSTVDLFPTLLGFAGAAAPENRPGVDLRPLIEGRGTAGRDAIIGTMEWVRGRSPEEPRGRGAFLRNERWHYLRFEDGREELFEMTADADPRRDVASENEAVVRSARRRVAAWASRMRESALASGAETRF